MSKVVKVPYPVNAKLGQSVRITGILPTRARDVAIAAFDAFEKHYCGTVEVIGRPDGIHLTRPFAVGASGIEEDAEEFALSIEKYFGFKTETSPVQMMFA